MILNFKFFFSKCILSKQAFLKYFVGLFWKGSKISIIIFNQHIKIEANDEVIVYTQFMIPVIINFLMQLFYLKHKNVFPFPTQNITFKHNYPLFLSNTFSNHKIKKKSI